MRSVIMPLGIGLAMLLGASALPAADLMQVYQTALERDAALRAAEARYRASVEARPLARSVLLPQVDGFATRAYTDVNPSGSSSFDYDTTRFELSLSQSVYDHSNWVALRQADLFVAQAAADRDTARQDLILRVAEAYFRVLAAEDNLTFARAEKEAIGRQLEQSQRRFEVGLIAITDVKESQATFDIAVAEEIRAINQLDIARELLAVITDEYYERLAVLTERMPLVSPDPEDMGQWVNTARVQNLPLIAQRFGTEVAAEEIKRQRAGHYPTVGLFASYTDTDFDSAPEDRFIDGRDTQVALQLRVPIYSGGRTSSLTREARENFDAAREAQDLLERQTVSLTRATYLSVVSGISRVRALNRALESTQAAHEAAEAGFEVGTRTAVDVLIALREVFRAQRDYAGARYDYLIDTLRLKQAAGILSEQDLVAVNTWLD